MTADEPQDSDLQLIERRHPVNDDRYSWRPFSLSQNFNDQWWHRPPYRSNSQWFIDVPRCGEEVARVELDDDVSADHYTGTPRLGASALEIQFLEVSVAHRCQGIGTTVVHLLRERCPSRRLVAFSEGADGFWSSLGWRRYDHPEGPRFYRPLFIDHGPR